MTVLGVTVRTDPVIMMIYDCFTYIPMGWQAIVPTHKGTSRMDSRETLHYITEYI